MMPGPNPSAARGDANRRGPIGHGGPMAMMKGETARNFRGTMRRLVRYLSDYRISLIALSCLRLASTVFVDNRPPRAWIGHHQIVRGRHGTDDRPRLH